MSYSKQQKKINKKMINQHFFWVQSCSNSYISSKTIFICVDPLKEAAEGRKKERNGGERRAQKV